MARNSIGKNLVLTSFGESHGVAIGAVLDGIPAGITINMESLQWDMRRRRPGQSVLSTPRNELDEVTILSGVFEGKTTGAPIAIIIENTDAQSTDYSKLATVFRPGHADLLYQYKYEHRDHRGGGRSSARITAGWVAAGNLAKQFLQSHLPIQTTAWVSQVYTVQCPAFETTPTIDQIEASAVRCPDAESAEKMQHAILEAKNSGDSLGGVISVAVDRMNIGLGEPVFGKLQSVISQYLFSINAVKGVSFGEGFHASEMKGSQHNDAWISTHQTENPFSAKTNHAGGIVGGISTGMPIRMEVAFKPTSTIFKPQETINSNFEPEILTAEGRHDPCVLPRAVPIVEAMVWLAIADIYLESSSKI